MRLCVCGALIERSACPYVYRWVNIFARSVPTYASVDECVDVCVHACAYVHACVCVHVSVYEYVGAAVYVYVHSSIHPFIYVPEQKIEIENRDHP